MTFNPAYPPTTNSLNRFKIWELPDFPQEQCGWGCYDLISSAALTHAIKDNSSMLSIDLNQLDSDLHRAYFQHLEADHSTAILIAEQMGQYLGFMLLALYRGDDANRDGNPDKDAAYWDYWSQVRKIYLGGGLASEKFGQILAKRAQKILGQHIPDYTIQLAQYPHHLGILGAARYVTSGQQAIVFDFGSTFVKRARAFYPENGLHRLELLDSIPFGYGLTVTENDADAILERFVSILVDTYQEGDTLFIPASISSYVSPSGQPYIGQRGIYMQMSHLSDNLPQLLSERVSEHIGQSITVKLIHDGTAAATFFSPLEHAAVITLGTAIGSGYPVPRPNLRNISPDLQVS